MRTDDFEYHLPEELIAQSPAAARDSCRLLCLERTQGQFSHHRFADIVDLLRPGDRLVLNDTRVLPARVFCTKSTGTRVEFLFTERIDETRWNALARPSKRLRVGEIVSVTNNPSLSLVVGAKRTDGSREVALAPGNDCQSIDELLEQCGEVPLPHYIQRSAERGDRDAYQTVYARCPGAVAAPTAGLHFTADLLSRLHDKGVDQSFVTLHVGVGTFRPVKADDPREHQMHEEAYVLPEHTVAEIMQTRQRGGRIIAVGTTVVRVLEHCAPSVGQVVASEGRTNILILPGYEFKIVDGLITNFHLPRSTLLMLVSAFAGRENVLAAYQEAVQERYRFYSYGDAMLMA